MRPLDDHYVGPKSIDTEALLPAQKVTIIVESAGTTIEATFAGNELIAGSAFEQTLDLRHLFSVNDVPLRDERRFHLDLSIRMASELNVLVTQEA